MRFLSCRWRKPAEDGMPDHCTHRDVLPMAGKEGFSADSWCTDCALYKAKRTPRKREEPAATAAEWRLAFQVLTDGGVRKVGYGSPHRSTTGR